jgi:hypothetical protein
LFDHDQRLRGFGPRRGIDEKCREHHEERREDLAEHANLPGEAPERLVVTWVPSLARQERRPRRGFRSCGYAPTLGA